MQLFYSQTSPYVRKVLVAAAETGQDGAIDRVAAAVSPVDRNASVAAANPLGKVPTMLADDGTALYDSRVICQYLDARHDGAQLYPADGAARWRVLTLEALADGLLDAAVLGRYESALRPDDKRWPDWMDGQLTKIDAALDELEKRADELDGPLHAGAIAAGCALGYVDFRYPERDWRASRPALARWYAAFAERPSMRDTRPE